MALATNAQANLYKGKGRTYFKKLNTTSWLDFGEATVLSITPEITKTPFYTNREGTKLKLFDTIDETSLTGTLTLLEMTKENAALALLAGDPTASTQSAGTLDAVSTTTQLDRFIDVGKIYVYFTKLLHGTVTGTGFEVGETVTGGTSSATGKIAWADTDYIEIVAKTGTFSVGETLTGGTSASTATLDSAVTVSGMVVTNVAGTTRYTKGTDYDEDALGGMIRENTGTTIASHTVAISADYSAKTQDVVAILSETAVYGELKFIGANDQGQRIHAWHPSVSLVADGELGLISEDNLELNIAVEILSDAATYPDTPYGTWSFIS